MERTDALSVHHNSYARIVNLTCNLRKVSESYKSQSQPERGSDNIKLS